MVDLKILLLQITLSTLAMSAASTAALLWEAVQRIVSSHLLETISLFCEQTGEATVLSSLPEAPPLLLIMQTTISSKIFTPPT